MSQNFHTSVLNTVSNLWFALAASFLLGALVTFAVVAQFDLAAPRANFQDDILQDGNVSPDELASSVWMVARCLDDNGVPHGAPVFEGDARVPRWHYQIGPMPAGFDPNATENPYDKCYASFQSRVDQVWAAQHAMSPAEQAVSEEAALRCAQRAGLHVPTFQDFMSLRETLAGADAFAAANCMSIAFNGKPLAGTAAATATVAPN